MGELPPEFWVAPKEAEGGVGEGEVSEARQEGYRRIYMVAMFRNVHHRPCHTRVSFSPQTHGLHGANYLCVAGIRRPQMGLLRLCLSAAGGPVRQQEMVGGEWHSIHNEFLGEGVRHKEVRAVLCHLTQRAGVCSESRPGRWQSAEEPGVSLDHHNQATAPKGCPDWHAASAPLVKRAASETRRATPFPTAGTRMSVAVAAATTQPYVVAAPVLPQGSWQHGLHTVPTGQRQQPGEDYRTRRTLIHSY